MVQAQSRSLAGIFFASGPLVAIMFATGESHDGLTQNEACQFLSSFRSLS